MYVYTVPGAEGKDEDEDEVEGEAEAGSESEGSGGTCPAVSITSIRVILELKLFD